jgi:hypothetical protein
MPTRGSLALADDYCTLVALAGADEPRAASCGCGAVGRLTAELKAAGA